MKEKWKLLRFVFAVLCLLPLCANATIDVNIYSDTTISSGDYGAVNIYDTPPDQTTVTMTGGTAESVWTYNSSIFNIMQNGNVSWVISAQDTSNITMSSGSIGSLQLTGYSIAYISGGSISGSLGIMEDTAIAHIYATNFNVAPKYGNPGNGWLITGNWDDATHSPFTIWSRNNTLPMPGTTGSQVIFHIVPEPVTLSFLLLGIMGLKNFRG